MARQAAKLGCGAGPLRNNLLGRAGEWEQAKKGGAGKKANRPSCWAACGHGPEERGRVFFQIFFSIFLFHFQTKFN